MTCSNRSARAPAVNLKRLIPLILLLGGALLPGPGCALPPMQLFVELTPPGGTLRPPAGIYAGPVEIHKPLTLDGAGRVTIDGGGDGTVLSILADDVVVRGIRFTNSGHNHDGVDAGILISADHALVENNTIDHTLFGIHLKKAYHNVIRGNRISSRPAESSLRGDGIRLWYSHENLIEENEFNGVRDLVLANSEENRILGNRVQNSRIGMQFIFSHDNLVQGNRISDNGTGIVVLYSNGLLIRDNLLEHMRSTSGSALALKESSGVVLEGNRVLHCAVGLSANAPIHPENTFDLKGNHFAYNDIVLYFYGEKGGHRIRDNRFEQNLTNVAVSAPVSARHQQWHGNYWDDYRGFDRDADGSGDTPHEIHAFADRIWLDRPMTRFFRGSPMLELIDFMERLAPFSEPQLILRDPAPRVRFSQGKRRLIEDGPLSR